MTAALTLAAAAGQAFDNLQVRFAAGQLKTQLTIFWEVNLNLFPPSAPGGRPVMNWFTILAALADKMPSGIPPLLQLNSSAQVIYRLCWMASYLQGTGAITNTQALDLLGSYNSVIAFP